ncbi:MAG: hypothetical protein JWO18_1392 [Microbacteriaceae bacterium]|jgi:hypothetical protein|nr:hypothetical protein [Microbacteriaceae bacterium]
MSILGLREPVDLSIEDRVSASPQSVNVRAGRELVGRT